MTTEQINDQRALGHFQAVKEDLEEQLAQVSEKIAILQKKVLCKEEPMGSLLRGFYCGYPVGHSQPHGNWIPRS